MIYIAKCLSIVTYNILPTICFFYNSMKKSTNILIPKMKLNPLSANFTKWLNTLKQFVGNLPTNCLSVFGHFVGLALKGSTELIQIFLCMFCNKMLRRFRENDRFFKIFLSTYIKRLHVRCNLSQNFSHIFYLKVLMLFTTEESFACKYFKQWKVGGYSLLFRIFRLYLKYFKYW